MTLGWAAICLVAIDLSVSLLFSYPNSPKELHPNPIALYFDYGRSMEARLRRETRADPRATAPITKAGWYDPLIATERPPKPNGIEVTIYGMSHAMRLADALQKVSPRYQVRSVGAPGATMNWSYGAFLRDDDRTQSKAAVLAIMSSTLPQILSPAPMDWNTSFPLPYTADRFYIQGGQLKRVKPPYESFSSYARALNDPPNWRRAVEQFSRTDPFFNGFFFRASVLDNSVVARLIRRGLEQRRDRAWRTRVISGKGYDRNSEAVEVANRIIADFARNARRQHILPIIYIVDSFGYKDQLYRSLAATLKRDQIPYIASHDYIDPMDPTGYLPDSHFTAKNDIRLATALAQLLDKDLLRTSNPKAASG